MMRLCPKCYTPLSGRTCACGFTAAPNGDYAMALPNYVFLNNRYILLYVIGAGGFGVTYKALDTKQKCLCAIKEYLPVGVARRDAQGMLVPENASKAEIYRHAKQRFLEEAYILQKLNALPTTASILDYFEENGTAYFVMEYIEGKTVKQAMADKGKFSLPEALNIVGAIATALEQIHTQEKIFHRDISPENIMLTPNGGVKLLDFGSAKIISKQTDMRFTVVLKAGYAPPEQYSSNSKQGPYTDVYALASTFYYMVTGTKIPQAPDRINGKRYAPLSQVMNVPAAFSRAVDHALELNRQNRTNSCARFWMELQNTVCGNRSEEKTGTGSPQRTKPEKYAPLPVKGAPYIAVQSGTRAFAVSLRANAIYKLGRGASNDIVLPMDQRISTLHFYCYYDAKSRMFAVKDVSRNGIRIGGRLLAKDRFFSVPPGTVLSLSENACIVTLRAE